MILVKFLSLMYMYHSLSLSLSLSRIADNALAFGGLVHYHATSTVIDPALALYIA